MSTLELVPEIRARRERIIAFSSQAVRRRILGQPIELPPDVKVKAVERPKRPEVVRRPAPPPKQVPPRPGTPKNILVILAAVADAYGVRVDELVGGGRHRSIAWPRQAAYVLAYEHTGLPLIPLSKIFNRDHTSLVHGIAVAKKRMDDPDWGPKFLRASELFSNWCKA